MKLELNKRYVNGLGDVVTVVGFDGINYSTDWIIHDKDILGLGVGGKAFFSFDGKFVGFDIPEFNLVEEFKMVTGEKYITGAGDVVTICDVTEAAFVASNGLCYPVNGNYCSKEHRIMHLYKRLEFKINSEYLLRNGRTVKIIAIIEGLQRPVIGIVGEDDGQWREDGAYYVARHRIPDLDIIAEKLPQFKKDQLVRVWDNNPDDFDYGTTSITIAGILLG